jgi:hypothetical protein
LVIDFCVLPVLVCRHLELPYASYVREALLPVVPGALVAGILAVLFLVVHPIHGGSTLRDGIQAAVSATIVVVAALATLLGVLFRVEPQFRDPLVARLRRRRS